MNRFKLFYNFYLKFFIRYFSFKKLKNLLLNIYEYRTNKTKLRSFPWIVSIDPANICPLNCPLCPTGRKEKTVDHKILTFEEFKRYFDPIKDYLFFIRLYNWGEPFLCKDIWEIINYAHKNNVGVLINSNFNPIDKKDVEKLIKYKVDYLMLSIDGVTQEIYEKYRRGGNLKKVFSLLSDLIKLKKEKKSKYPFIHWQFLLSKKNECELEQTQEKAREIGVDLFETHSLCIYTTIDAKFDKQTFDEWVSRPGLQPQLRCKFLWTSANITPAGFFDPCCGIYNKKYHFGNLNEKNFSEIWNNNLYQEARERFVVKNFKPRTNIICHQCTRFK